MPSSLSNLKLFTFITLLWLLLISVVGIIRPLYYSNQEMHYASIAWEMWQHHHFILPVQGGEPYTEKGPLLFWMIHLGWWLFGVSSWWMRLVPELFGLFSLFLTRQFALRLWPEEKITANLAPLILLGSFMFAAKVPVMRFDVIATFFILLCIYSLFSAVTNSRLRELPDWFLFSGSLACSLLIKGPVVFLFILPAALTITLWTQPKTVNVSMKKYLLYLLLSLFASIALVCVWVIPAVWEGGTHYGYSLLFNRSVARIWNIPQYLHQNWLFYFYTSACMLLPWIIWPPFWQALRKEFRSDGKQRDPHLTLLIIELVSAFIALTFVAQKAPRYILPTLPFAAIAIAHLLHKHNVRIQRWHQIFIASGYMLIGIFYIFIPYYLSPATTAKYPWFKSLPWYWGMVLCLIGFFWLIWKEQRLTTVVLGITLSTTLFWTCFHLGITAQQTVYGDWRNLGLQVNSLQKNGQVVAFVGQEQDLEFFGRLKEPLISLPTNKVAENWAEAHPDGWIVIQDYAISPMQLKLISAKNYEKI